MKIIASGGVQQQAEHFVDQEIEEFEHLGHHYSVLLRLRPRHKLIKNTNLDLRRIF